MRSGGHFLRSLDRSNNDTLLLNDVQHSYSAQQETTKLLVQWDPLLILLSFLVSAMGSLVAVYLMDIRRRVYLHGKENAKPRLLIILAAGSTLGGIAIWSMHFTGMAAMQLIRIISSPATTANSTDPDGGAMVKSEERLSIDYEVYKTSMSLFFPVLLMSSGLLIASRDKFHEIVSERQKTHLALRLVRNKIRLKDLTKNAKQTQTRMKVIVLFQDSHWILAGGVVAGAGTVVMHYLGMAAMTFPGYMVFSPGVVVATIIIATLISSVAFWILFRLLSLFNHWQTLRPLCAFVLASGICLTHYTGMYGAKYIHSTATTRSPHAIHLNGQTAQTINTLVAMSWCFWMLSLGVIPVLDRKLAGNLAERSVGVTPQMQQNGSMGIAPGSLEDAEALRAMASPRPSPQRQLKMSVSSQQSVGTTKPPVRSHSISSTRQQLRISITRGMSVQGLDKRIHVAEAPCFEKHSHSSVDDPSLVTAREVQCSGSQSTNGGERSPSLDEGQQIIHLQGPSPTAALPTTEP